MPAATAGDRPPREQPRVTARAGLSLLRALRLVALVAALTAALPAAAAFAVAVGNDPELGVPANLDYASDGLVCTIVAPAA